MDPMKLVTLPLQSERPLAVTTTFTNSAPERSLSNVLQLVGSFDELDDGTLTPRKPSGQDWSKLIERIHYAANHVREVEANSLEQEMRVKELLQRAQEDLSQANERVRAAETRAAELQARSEVLLRAAEKRVRAAEEQASVAEDWLARVYDTVVREFAIEPGEGLTK